MPPIGFPYPSAVAAPACRRSAPAVPGAPGVHPWSARTVDRIGGAFLRPRSSRQQRGRLRRAARAGGAATALATGALAITLLVPNASAAGPVLPKSIHLLSNSIASAIGQLLDAQQQVENVSGAFPFISSSDLPLLPAHTQNMTFEMLVQLVNQSAFQQFSDPFMPWGPYQWSASAADPQPFGELPNPDTQFGAVSIAPDQTYVVTVSPHSGTEDLSLQADSGNGVDSDFAATGNPHSLLDLNQATPNADGTYTFILSPTEQPGNWINTSDAGIVMVRDTVGDWGQMHDSVSIQAEGGSSSYTIPELSNSQILSMLNTVATDLPSSGTTGTNLDGAAVGDLIPDNKFSPIQETSSTFNEQTLTGQISALGHYSLQPDQALIVKVPDIAAGYSGIQLTNGWGETLPYATVQSSLDNAQAFHDPDGFTYYVISDQNPGVANWLDDSGVADGTVFLRWQNATGSVPATPIQTEVVPVTEVGQYLPADTPTVTATQYAAELQERLFEYDYVQDQSHDQGWVTTNLELDQIKSAMGADQFTQIFGSQNDVPSVMDRMTDSALMPDVTAIGHDILSAPSDTLSAVVQNLPLLAKDIELPMVLAALRLDMLIGSPGSLGTGMQGLETFFNDTFVDPATSITSGFLNARDDLGTTISNAGSYAPLTSADMTSVSDQLSQLNQSLWQMLTGGLNSVFDPVDAATQGSDAAANAAGLASDLLP